MDGAAPLPNPAMLCAEAQNYSIAVLRTPANVSRNIFFPFSGGADYAFLFFANNLLDA